MPVVVSDTGPLIALASINQFDLLGKLFGNLLIPPAVNTEILDDITKAAVTGAEWISIQAPQNKTAVRLLNEELDAGESEAVVLARELNADLVLIDERAARRKSRAIGVTTIGTLGILLLAKERGLVKGIKPSLDKLRNAGFRMSDEIYHRVLKTAGENDNL